MIFTFSNLDGYVVTEMDKNGAIYEFVTLGSRVVSFYQRNVEDTGIGLWLCPGFITFYVW